MARSSFETKAFLVKSSVWGVWPDQCDGPALTALSSRVVQWSTRQSVDRQAEGSIPRSTLDIVGHWVATLKATPDECFVFLK